MQILSHYDAMRETRAKIQHNQELLRHQGDPENTPKPQEKAPRDSIFNKGTFTGLGVFLQSQDEIGFLGLHEGKSWLPHTFDNGPGGGVDDLNQIHDHDIYKNHPGNTSTRFLVRNPHLCGVVMMHIEEIYDQAKKPDSTAGMLRFLTGHFKPVINKILPPDATPGVIAQLLEQDP
eukprot:7993503-Karenia_brevis.AAC.1